MNILKARTNIGMKLKHYRSLEAPITVEWVHSDALEGPTLFRLCEELRREVTLGLSNVK